MHEIIRVSISNSCIHICAGQSESPRTSLSAHHLPWVHVWTFRTNNCFQTLLWLVPSWTFCSACSSVVTKEQRPWEHLEIVWPTPRDHNRTNAGPAVDLNPLLSDSNRIRSKGDKATEKQKHIHKDQRSYTCFQRARWYNPTEPRQQRIKDGSVQLPVSSNKRWMLGSGWSTPHKPRTRPEHERQLKAKITGTVSFTDTVEITGLRPRHPGNRAQPPGTGPTAASLVVLCFCLVFV